jgi:regulator of RNase E activity RraA
MPVGLRIHTEINRPDPALLERFMKYSSADLSDVMNMAGTLDRGIRPAYLPIKKIVGPAVTIVVPTGAQNVRKMGFETAQAGDVIVMNGHGILHYAMLGANIGRGIFHRGVAGMVMDGAFRDIADFREMGLPMYSRGVCTLPGPKEGPGEVNIPIACGGVVVNPGDIIVADEDGIVAIPPAHAEEILAAADKLTAGFAAIQDQLLQGAVTGIDAIEKKLRDGGWEYIDRPYGQS